MNRLILLILVFFFAQQHLFAQQQALYLKSWKKKKEIPVKMGVGISITRIDTLIDTGNVELYYTGMVCGFSATHLFLKVYKSDTRDRNNHKISQTYTTRDTSLLPTVSVPFGNISRLSFTRKDSAESRVEDILIHAGIATVFLAPIASVNHFNGTFSSSAFGIMIASGYLVPIICGVAIMGHYEAYQITGTRPLKRGKHEYFLETK